MLRVEVSVEPSKFRQPGVYAGVESHRDARVEFFPRSRWFKPRVSTRSRSLQSVVVTMDSESIDMVIYSFLSSIVWIANYASMPVLQVPTSVLCRRMDQAGHLIPGELRSRSPQSHRSIVLTPIAPPIVSQTTTAFSLPTPLSRLSTARSTSSRINGRRKGSGHFVAPYQTQFGSGLPREGDEKPRTPIFHVFRKTTSSNQETDVVPPNRYSALSLPSTLPGPHAA